MIAECIYLAQKEYKLRHDIARIVHLELCQKFGLVDKVQWYNHKPASAVENDRVRILWDFNIQTPYHSTKKIWYSCAVQNWKKVSPHWYCCAWGQKDCVERSGKNRQLQQTKTRSEKDQVWNLSQVVVVSVANGALGVTSKRLKNWLKKLDVKSSIELLQKAASLGTAKIARQVLETWGCWVQLALKKMYWNYQLNQDKHNNNNNNWLVANYPTKFCLFSSFCLALLLLILSFIFCSFWEKSQSQSLML